MEYKLGNSRKIKTRGETAEITCPKCGKVVKLGVFSNFERHLAVKPTLFDLNTVYFLICPECAAVFTVDEHKGKQFTSGESEITADDLMEFSEIK